MLRKTIGSLFKVLPLCDDVLPVQAKHVVSVLGSCTMSFRGMQQTAWAELQERTASPCSFKQELGTWNWCERNGGFLI